MPVVSQDEVAVAYRVEVSGWDSKQEFFVEKNGVAVIGGGWQRLIKASADAAKGQRGLKISGAGCLVSGAGASRATK